MRARFAISFLGFLSACLACAFAFAAVVDGLFFQDGGAGVFFSLALAAAALAGTLILAARGKRRPLAAPDLCFIAFIGFAASSLAAAVPFFIILDVPFHLAFFEAVSGITTTGASVLDVQNMPFSLLFWRSFMQWIGGFAAILVALLILAPLGVGGIEPRAALIRAPDDAPAKYKIRQALRIAAPPYALLTLACFIFLLLAKTPPFAALCISFSTLSTGGLLPPLSPNFFNLPHIQIILSFFMIAGAANFALLHAAIRRPRALAQNNEARLAFALLIAAALLFAIISLAQSGAPRFVQSLFTAASLLSTTGFFPQNAPTPPAIATLLLIFIGGMTLSTAGGVKVVRCLFLFKQSRRELRRLAQPHGVIPASFAPFPKRIGLMQSVWMLFFLFLVSLVSLSLFLSACGINFTTAFAAALAVLANAGPALQILNAADYQNLPQTALWGLSLGMIAGRMEFVLFFVVFTPAYWRQ